MLTNKSEVNDLASTSITNSANLSYNQKQRFAVLRNIFPDDSSTYELITLLEPRGENSYQKVSEKLQNIMKADYLTQRYHDLLSENFEVGVTYTENQVMGIIGALRRDIDLDTYLTGIKKNSLRDLFSVFLVKTEIDEISSDLEQAAKQKKSIRGYTPLFKLKPEDE
ncbi:MAG: hypothetical protein WC615_04835 [Mucilaginibacter sp.]|jgi:hypothetical protein|uniref:hypothetical protein n=1 Tax=Mucilaginibacter sp. TaxID=1882438 RepID=UPI0035636A4A